MTRRLARPSEFGFSEEFRNVRGATPDAIGAALASFAGDVQPEQEIVELGVFQGRTALIMAWGAARGRGAHVTGIDPWDLSGNVYDPPFTDRESREAAAENIARLGYRHRIRLIQGFSHDEAAVWPYAGEGDKRVGLLFVDGDHTRAGARRDIETWAPHLAPGAVIAIDDYGHPDWPGVGQAVDELVAEGLLTAPMIHFERLAVTGLTAAAVLSMMKGSSE
jgi:predicted O-methyltransferase YrrM